MTLLCIYSQKIENFLPPFWNSVKAGLFHPTQPGFGWLTQPSKNRLGLKQQSMVCRVIDSNLYLCVTGTTGPVCVGLGARIPSPRALLALYWYQNWSQVKSDLKFRILVWIRFIILRTLVTKLGIDTKTKICHFDKPLFCRFWDSFSDIIRSRWFV